MSNQSPSRTDLELTVSLLDAALESTADGLLVVDTPGRIVKYNRRFARMWRIPDEVLAKGIDERALESVLDQLKRPDEFLAKVQYLYAHPKEDSYDLLEFKDGRYFERYSQPQLLGTRVVGRVWSFRDVTRQKKAENALLDSRRHLEEFLSIASHELRTPLTSLKAQIQLINRFLTDGRIEDLPREKLLRMAQLSDHEINRFTDLIETLLDVSRISAHRLSIRLRECELSEILRGVLERLDPQLKSSGCEARLSVSGRILGHWDPYRLEQVLINLISNAMKYGKGRPIHLSAALEGQEAVIHVRDEGVGIERDDQERIFERFERADRDARSGGMGLGLFIAKEIVRAHSGSMSVTSEPGRGSDFQVRIPLRAETGPQ